MPHYLELCIAFGIIPIREKYYTKIIKQMLKICRLLFPVKYGRFFALKNQNINRTLP